jgi:hypothetical protein
MLNPTRCTPLIYYLVHYTQPSHGTHPKDLQRTQLIDRGIYQFRAGLISNCRDYDLRW